MGVWVDVVGGGDVVGEEAVFDCIRVSAILTGLNVESFLLRLDRSVTIAQRAEAIDKYS